MRTLPLESSVQKQSVSGEGRSSKQTMCVDPYYYLLSFIDCYMPDRMLDFILLNSPGHCKVSTIIPILQMGQLRFSKVK